MFNDDAMRKIKAQAEAWQKDVYGCHRELPKKFETLSGFTVKPVYTPDDLSAMDYIRDLGFSGVEPFIRGIHPTMYRGRTRTHRQLAGFGPPEETNKRYRFLLKQGATGIT